VIGVCLAAIAFDGDADASVLAFSIFGPIGLSGLVLILSWSAFWVGTVTGTPLISFTYAYSEAKRNWQGVAGVLLLVSALMMIIVLVNKG
jgi:hypothetical protein